jgi:hypothetical protein
MGEVIALALKLGIGALPAPVIPEGNKTHDLGLGSHLATLKASGSARTVLMGIGALVIVGSFVEAVR